ncbi:MAG: hypothetical protein RBR59_04055 [Sulfurimonadaceae bacterium]|jgi:hypothetical protein|nr:hypothetical protein [Sulfurimonadaceae bacterium]
MPLQNRVSPAGVITAISSRGSLMGNRGILHDENKELKAVSKIKGWVTCHLEYKGRKRELMAKNRYTELFFLDEVTAFAAGHRPCAECRRERYNEFKTKWLEANSKLLNGEKESITNIDNILHKERIDKTRKVTFNVSIDILPTGAMIKIEEQIYLLWENRLYLWSFDGYEKTNIIIKSQLVEVLTPYTYIKMFQKGFKPDVHSSVE